MKTIKLILLLIASGTIGALTQYIYANLNKDIEVLNMARDSYFIGCVRSIDDIAGCKKKANLWKDRIKNTVGMTP